MEGSSKLPSTSRLRRKQSSTLKTISRHTAGNIFVQIEPPVVQFCGYELNKTSTLTVKIINKATLPQRINIVPLNSQQFKLKVDKKGAIPTGMSQTIQVEFVATEYKYYSDIIRIGTETQNFQIPVHAYPILMSKDQLLKTIPKMIDFGSVVVGQTETNVYPLTSQIPIDFEFEFVFKKESANIVVQPMKGVVQGLGTVEIKIMYTPTIKMTNSAQLYLNISQYNFEPILFNVFGSGKQKELKSMKNLRPGSSRGVDQSANSNFNNKSLLQSRRLSNTKYDGKDFTKSIVPSNLPKLSESRKLTSTLVPKQSVREEMQTNDFTIKRGAQKQFLDHYNQVYTTDKQKQIKFAVYFGDSPLTEAQIQEIKQLRISQKYDRLKQLQELSVQRHTLDENRSPPAIDYGATLVGAPTYDRSNNDVLKKRQKLLQRFNKAASNVLIRNRMLKRLRKIMKAMRQAELGVVTNTAPSSGKVAQRIDILTKGINLKVTMDSFIMSSFKLQFQQAAELSKQTLEILATNEFDDAEAVELLQDFEPEVMNYEPVLYPPVYMGLVVQTPPQRPGSQQEYPFKSAAVPNPVYPPLLGLYGLPLSQPFYTYILDHPTIKLMERDDPQVENSLGYLWKNTKRVDDEHVGWSEGDPDVMKAKFLKGMDCPFTSVSGLVGSERNYDIGFVQHVQKHCPKLIQKPALDDPFSDQDSDNDQYPTFSVANPADLLKKIQSDNSVFQSRRKIPLNQLKSDLSMMDAALGAIKKKQLSIAPSLQQDLNKKTEKSDSKLIIVGNC